MASCVVTGMRAASVVLLAVSLAIAIVGCFVPFFHYSTHNKADAQSMRASYDDALRTIANTTSSASAVSAAQAVVANFTALQTSIDTVSMDLWHVTYRFVNETTRPKEKIELRSDYFACKNGKANIQAAEAVAVVTCVLICANLILSFFSFTFSTVVRVPLAIYAFLGAASAGVTFGIMVNLYVSIWCSEDAAGNAVTQSLKDQGWKIDKAGMPLFVVSLAVSVTVGILTSIAC